MEKLPFILFPHGNGHYLTDKTSRARVFYSSGFLIGSKWKCSGETVTQWTGSFRLLSIYFVWRNKARHSHEDSWRLPGGMRQSAHFKYLSWATGMTNRLAYKSWRVSFCELEHGHGYSPVLSMQKWTKAGNTETVRRKKSISFSDHLGQSHSTNKDSSSL
ncbi:uncharacterized protein LOC144306414 [Canis aureus]